MVERLQYKRFALIKSAIVSMFFGLASFSLAFTSFENKHGIIGLLIKILGPNGMHLLMGVTGILLMIAALRFVYLSLDGALAASTSAEGIHVRTPYYSGLIPWTVVEAITCRVVTGWGKHPVLVIHRADDPGPLLWLVGLGNKMLVHLRLLDATQEEVDSWIDHARHRGRPPKTESIKSPSLASKTEFGRRR